MPNVRAKNKVFFGGFVESHFATLLKSRNGHNLCEKRLLNLPGRSAAGSHIPRALRFVYDIRNKRDLAHLADGIDPNLQDATVVCSVIDWVLAEFIRLYHNIPPDEASRLVAAIVTRAVPVIQDFNGFLKVMKPNLAVSDHCLVLLYQRGDQGCTFQELELWARPSMRSNLGRTLRRLTDSKDLAHFDGQRYFITRLGQQEAEARHLVEP